MLSLFILPKLVWKNEMRENFPAVFSKLAFAAGILLELSLYYFTSRTFGEQISLKEGSYFNFVIVGELAVMLPLGIVSALLFSARDGIQNGLLEFYMTLPGKKFTPLFTISLGPILRQLIYVVVFIFTAFALFGFRLSLEQFGWILLVQALALPGFLALGLIFTAFFLRYGRGASSFDFFLKAGMILSGVYFPTTVFPEIVQKLGILFSPINALVELCRMNPVHDSIPQMALASLLLWTISACVICPFLVSSSFQAIRRRGSIEMPNYSAT